MLGLHCTPSLAVLVSASGMAGAFASQAWRSRGRKTTRSISLCLRDFLPLASRFKAMVCALCCGCCYAQQVYREILIQRGARCFHTPGERYSHRFVGKVEQLIVSLHVGIVTVSVGVRARSRL